MSFAAAAFGLVLAGRILLGMGGVDIIWLGAIGMAISLGAGIALGVRGMSAIGLVISLGVGVLLGVGMMVIWLRREPSGPSATKKRTVKTQSQTRYTWTRSEPRFLPLAIQEHGIWSDSDIKMIMT